MIFRMLTILVNWLSGDSRSSVKSNNRALILGTKYSYFWSWTHKTDSQTCQSNQDQHAPRYSSTVGNKLLLKGVSLQMKFTSGRPTPGEHYISWNLREERETNLRPTNVLTDQGLFSQLFLMIMYLTVLHLPWGFELWICGLQKLE